MTWAKIQLCSAKDPIKRMKRQAIVWEKISETTYLTKDLHQDYLKNCQNSTVKIPGGSDGKASAYNAGDLGLIPESGGSPGERNGYPLQYSFLKNFTGRGAWRATDHGISKVRHDCD